MAVEREHKVPGLFRELRSLRASATPGLAPPVSAG